MKLSSNTDFFQQNQPQSPPLASPSPEKQQIPVAHKTKPFAKSRISKEAASLIKQTVELLRKCNLENMSRQVEQIYKDTFRERFVVTVVGEFSRGKSTFLNNLFGQPNILPVGNLPTTAVMTRIRYNPQPKMAVFDEKGIRVTMMDLKPESWKGLTSNNFGENEVKGSVVVGLNDQWLGSNGLELIDCPGAGDLSEERARQIGDALNRADGAIIAVSALAALSISEKTFIQQRILSRKTPFTMLIVTKLDLVKKEERNGIIKHIHDVLALNKMNIPVFIPANIEMADDTYQDFMGMDKVKAAIEGWVTDAHRQELTDIWVKARACEIVKMAIKVLSDQQELLLQGDEKRRELIAKKKLALEKLSLEWGEMTLNLMQKSNECYAKFLKKTDEYTADITEKLQYEASHTANPQKWWAEDYPYRLKVELANMSVGLENLVVKTAANDARWFNQLLDQKFKTLIQTGSYSVADKDEYKSAKSGKELEFEDVSKKVNLARLGTAALSIAGYFLMAPGLGILATLGIGTGGSILTSLFAKKKLEQQHEEMKMTIAKDIPNVVARATENSEKRVQSLYEDMLKESEKKKDLWLESQQQAVETANMPKNEEQKAKLASQLEQLRQMEQQFNQ